jgi:hypothetical protein
VRAGQIGTERDFRVATIRELSRAGSNRNAKCDRLNIQTVARPDAYPFLRRGKPVG